ncbi:MAG: hypothetical protein ABR509_01130 [Candidatus Limnocylindria bacterium]
MRSAGEPSSSTGSSRSWRGSPQWGAAWIRPIASRPASAGSYRDAAQRGEARLTPRVVTAQRGFANSRGEELEAFVLELAGTDAAEHVAQEHAVGPQPA